MTAGRDAQPIGLPDVKAGAVTLPPETARRWRMPVSDLPLLTAMKQRLQWLGQRQVVLAENVANADTPSYRPKDLAPQRFRDMVDHPARLALAVTQTSHLGHAAEGATAAKVETSRDTYEIAPAGNAVVLEEQMAKVQETAIDHKLVNQLYRKYLGMLRIAASARG